MIFIDLIKLFTKPYDDFYQKSYDDLISKAMWWLLLYKDDRIWTLSKSSLQKEKDESTDFKYGRHLRYFKRLIKCWLRSQKDSHQSLWLIGDGTSEIDVLIYNNKQIGGYLLEVWLIRHASRTWITKKQIKGTWQRTGIGPVPLAALIILDLLATPPINYLWSRNLPVRLGMSDELALSRDLITGPDSVNKWVGTWLP